MGGGGLQAEDGRRDAQEARGSGEVDKRQCVSWQRQTEDTATPEGAGAPTEAVPVPGKRQLIQYALYSTVNRFSL